MKSQHCRCGSNKNLFKNHIRLNGLIDWMCRKCNTERVKKYRKTENGRLKIREAVYRSIKKHYNKQVARVKAKQAVERGKILKPKKCSVCLKRKKLFKHHPDYNKPLEIIWACRECHLLEDKKEV